MYVCVYIYIYVQNRVKKVPIKSYYLEYFYEEWMLNFDKHFVSIYGEDYDYDYDYDYFS